jgi:hypothetical protein
MAVVDKIHRRVLVLPEPLQAEVLDFVEFLLSKVEVELQDDAPDFDHFEWSNISLAMALRGMEDEEEPNYTMADIKEMF